MASPQGYNALNESDANPFAQVIQPQLETDNEDEAPQSGIMIHVVPETNRGKMLFVFVMDATDCLVFSSMESYRRFRLIFYENVHLSSTTRIQHYDAERDVWFASIPVCCCSVTRTHALHQL